VVFALTQMFPPKLGPLLTRRARGVGHCRNDASL
jgi:hypothetical protein